MNPQEMYSRHQGVFCKHKIQKVAGKNGECCISVLENVAGRRLTLRNISEAALQTYA